MGFTRHSIITVLAGAGLTVAMSFNSCSDVKFSENASNGDLCLPGEGSPDCQPELVDYEDNFTVPASTKKVDILLVLDNSGSMSTDLTKLAARLDGLIEILDNGGIDWQMCHVLTGTGSDSLARDWSMPSGIINKKVLLPSTPNKTSVFLNTTNTIPKSGSGNEQGIIAIREALIASENAPCFRTDAALSVVLISDEDEKSCGGRCLDWITSEVPAAPQYRDGSEYRKQYRELVEQDDPQKLVDWVKATYGNKVFITHSIVIQPGDNSCYDVQDKTSPAFFAVLYKRLQSLTGGIAGNICADSYADQLTDMGNRTRDAINSVTLRCAPVLAPVVSFNPAMPSVTWAVSGDKVIFSTAVPEGTLVNVKYVCAK